MAKLRMNCKTVKERVAKYVESEIEDINELINDFNKYNKFDYQGHNNLVDFVVSMGTYGFTVWYSEQRRLIKEWLNETEEEANKYNDDQVYKTYCYIVENVILNKYGLQKELKYDFRNKPNSKSYMTIQKKD